MGENIEENNGLPEGYTLHLGDGVELAHTYDEENGGVPEGHEDEYRESDPDYASEHAHRRGEEAHNHRQNASDADWERWEDDVDNGKASKATGDAVNQRRQGKKNIVQAAENNPGELTEDKTDCLSHNKDCAGICWGESTPDTQGGCCLKHEKDCAGVCFGDSIWININSTQYSQVGSHSSQQGDYKCCSRSDSNCCQTQMCTGGCPEKGSGAQAVFNGGKLCMCDPKEITGCCHDLSKDCKRRCPYEEGYGSGCQRWEVMCSSNPNGYECQRQQSGGTWMTEHECHSYVSTAINAGHTYVCEPGASGTVGIS